MRKHIGTKVIVMIGILVILFVGTCLANTAALGEIGKRNKEITDTYMKMEECQGDIAALLQEIRLLTNLVVLKEDTEMVSGMLDGINGKVGGLEQKLSTNYELCQKTGNKKLTDAYSAYKEKINGFAEKARDVAEKVKAGNKKEAVQIVDGLYQYITDATGDQEAYQKELKAQIANVAEHSDIKISGTYAFEVVMMVLYLLSVAVVLVVLQKTVAAPPKMQVNI